MNKKIDAFKVAFPYTLPICAGFTFLGLSYGIFMNKLGFSFWYPSLMAAFIFAGSMEFVAANLLLAPFNPLNVLILTLIINARHIFYGISMLTAYKDSGKKKWFLIFGMCDESFSINFSVKVPKNVDKYWFMFFITLLNYSYWVIGSAVGGILGNLIKFDVKGIEFVMTALFVVIFLEQWKMKKGNISAITGVTISVLCLVLFGSDSFIVPSMFGILLALIFMKKKLEKADEIREEIVL